MFAKLKHHPFAIEAFFESSLVLTYAVLKEELSPLLPPCLELDTFENKWGFVAVAIVKTKKLRPKGFPAFLGRDFTLTGYRIFVRYTTSAGKRLRGLYILRSETNRRGMAFWGNIFTHYRYSTTDIAFTSNGSGLRVRSRRSALNIVVSCNQPELPATSPFADWKQARRFAGPLPFTFTILEPEKQVLLIEGVRENWTPAPVTVVSEDVGFLQALNLKTVVLANAFLIENVPYYWKQGKIDTWKQ